MSSYDLWKTTPVENDDDVLIEKRVEELLAELTEALANSHNYQWFDLCVDWDKVHSYLEKEAENQLKEARDEAKISAWEDSRNYDNW